MYRDDLAPLLQGHLLDHCRPRNAGIVDEAVDDTDARLEVVHRRLRELRIGHAADIGHELAIRRRSKCVKLVTVKIDTNTPRAQSEPQLRDRLPDTLRGPGNDN